LVSHKTQPWLLLPACLPAAAAATGSWVLRVADVPALGSATDVASSPITLTGWSITICFTQAPVPAVASTQGDEDTAAAAATQPAAGSGNETASSNTTMAGNMTVAGNSTTGQVRDALNKRPGYGTCYVHLLVGMAHAKYTWLAGLPHDEHLLHKRCCSGTAVKQDTCNDQLHILQFYVAAFYTYKT
jgi:hypothetical protein